MMPRATADSNDARWPPPGRYVVAKRPFGSIAISVFVPGVASDGNVSVAGPPAPGGPLPCAPRSASPLGAHADAPDAAEAASLGAGGIAVTGWPALSFPSSASAVGAEAMVASEGRLALLSHAEAAPSVHASSRSRGAHLPANRP